VVDHIDETRGQLIAGTVAEAVLAGKPRTIAGKVQDPPYKDRVCQGMRIHIQDRSRFRSVRFSLELIRVVKEQYPEKIFQGSNSLTLMFGTDGLARFLRGDLPFSDLMDRVRRDEERFLRQRKPYLLY